MLITEWWKCFTCITLWAFPTSLHGRKTSAFGLLIRSFSLLKILNAKHYGQSWIKTYKDLISMTFTDMNIKIGGKKKWPLKLPEAPGLKDFTNNNTHLGFQSQVNSWVTTWKNFSIEMTFEHSLIFHLKLAFLRDALKTKISNTTFKRKDPTGFTPFWLQTTSK